MMKTGTILLFLSLFCSISMIGQVTFQKSLGIKMDTTFIRCEPNGQSVFIVGKTKENGQLKVHLLKIDGAGTLIWRKQYLYSINYDVKAITLLSDGIVVVLSSDTEGVLLKLNSQDGALAWQKSVGNGEKLQVYEADSDDKDNIWINGLHLKSAQSDSNYYFQFKMDKSGLPLFGKQATFLPDIQKFIDIRYFKPTNLTWQASSHSMLCVQDFKSPFTKATYYVFNNGRKQLAFTDENMSYIEQDLETNFIDLVASGRNLALSGADFMDSTKLLFGILNEQGTNYLHLRTSDGLMRPIHNNDGSFVFYSMKYKTLTKYDAQMNPIWTKKYDNCINTAVFSADIAQDGSIFSVRNVAGETVVNRINGNGSLANCVDYKAKAVKDTNQLKIPAVTYKVDVFPLKMPVFKDTVANEVMINTEITPFCLKIDATFQYPDSVCINSNIKPTEIDSNINLVHNWRFDATDTTIAVPNINFNSLGVHRIYHRLDLNSCIDTSSKVVFVIPEVFIPLKDTVVCGRNNLTIDLFSKYADAYYQNGQSVKSLIKIESSGVYNLKIVSKNCTAESKVKVKINDFALPVIKQDSIPCNGLPYAIVFDPIFGHIIWDKKPVKDTFYTKDRFVHQYSVTYKADTACVIKGNVAIERKDCDDLYVPTAFSPNDDQINDVFQSYPQANHRLISFSVFDRWGDLIYQSVDKNFSWDGTFKGKACATGVYIYYFRYFNAKTQEEEVKSGDVTLMH